MRRLLLTLSLPGTSALGCSGASDPALMDLAAYHANGFGLDKLPVKALVSTGSGFCPAEVRLGAVGPRQPTPGMDFGDPGRGLQTVLKYPGT